MIHPAAEKHVARPALSKKGWIIAAIVVLVVVVLIVMRGGGGQVVKDAPGTRVNIESVELLSDVSCSGSGIEGKITNVLSKKLEMSSVRVLLDGQEVNTALLKCDKEVLSPGESTKCASLNGISPVAGDNEVAVVLDESKSDKALITC